MSRFWRAATTLLLVLLMAGCNSKPGDQAIRQQVTDRLNQQYGDAIFEVVNFKKTNGFPRDDNTYIAEVEYDLRFKVDLKDASKALQPQSSNIFAAGVQAAALGLTYGDFKAGDVQHLKERVRFVRADKGWLIDEQQ